MVKTYGRGCNNDLQNQKSGQTSTNIYFDEADAKIMELLLLGKNNKEIATQIRIPLSTIQRSQKSNS